MDKVSLPLTSVTGVLDVQGVFGVPEQWKTTDDSNPGLFTYQLRFMEFQASKGKVYPRQSTPKELRQLQEKNKKGGKKDSKDPAEQQKIRKQQEAEEQAREEKWLALPQEDQKYRQFEDPFVASQLRFQTLPSQKSIQGKQYIILKQRVAKDNGEWLYFFKMPAVSEEELAKLRKAKPKTLNNINDLNPVIMRAWVDLSALQKDTSLRQRCPLEQVNKTAQTPEPNLEKAYVKVGFRMQSLLWRGDDGVRGSGLIGEAPQGKKISDKQRVLGDLSEELRVGIESLAMEYASMFWKQLNTYDQLRQISPFTSRKGDSTKRKEQFLYDFNVSGKYKVLKDRLKKTIVHLCEKYFSEQMGGAKAFTGVTCSIRDQFYSHIYSFLVGKYKAVLHQLTFEKRQSLREVDILSVEAQKREVERVLREWKEEDLSMRAERVVTQYEIVGLGSYGEGIYQQLIQQEPENVSLKYKFALYGLRTGVRSAGQVLPFFQDYLALNRQDSQAIMEYLLLLIASDTQQNARKAWVFLRELIQQDPSNTRYLMLAALLFSEYLKQQQQGQLFLFLTERIQLRNKQKIPAQGQQKENPIASELPSIQGPAKFSQSLSQSQNDALWIQLFKLVTSINLDSVAQKIKQKVSDPKHQAFQLIDLKETLSRSRQQFYTKAAQVYAQTNSRSVLQLLAGQLASEASLQAQQYLKALLLASQGSKQAQVMLKMGYYYLKLQKYGNSRACLLKYLQKQPENSGLSWRSLGICELNLGWYLDSIECFKRANLSDTLNRQNWILLARAYAASQNFLLVNQCLNQYQRLTPTANQNNQNLASLLKKLQSQKSDSLNKQKMRTQLIDTLLQLVEC